MPAQVACVALAVHPTRPAALNLAASIADWLDARGISVVADSGSAGRLQRKAWPADLAGVDAIVTLGGDGTILTAARIAAPHGVPILGVHLGRFGFISEAHPEDVYRALGDLLDGRLQVEERMMLRGEIDRSGRRVHSAIGLNDVVVRSGSAHMVRIVIRLGNAEFASCYSDGAIVATSTGSTAYALSAGGPIIAPAVRALLFVPICAHTLNVRPLVLPPDETVELSIDADGREVWFDVDGLDQQTVVTGDRILVQRADHVLRLYTFGPGAFYRKVRGRYLYGERLNS